MCGRFQISVKGKHISERFNVEVFDEMYTPVYNAAPSQKLPVITNTEASTLNYFKWGLIPFWAKDPRIGFKMINARAENISEKPAFRNAFARRRCLIPANGFYEWKKTDKTPYRIFLKTDELFAFAGIWESWKDADQQPIHTFAIITTRPNSLMASIHDRMPVILKKQHEEEWLHEPDLQKLSKLLLPYEAEKMDAYPISKAVNAPVNNGPEIIVPDDFPRQEKLF